MVREEQIKQQADKYNSEDLGEDITNIIIERIAFIEGAKWADENPKKGLISIDNVCELLKKHINIPGFENVKIEWIKQFRKVMEE